MFFKNPSEKFKFYYYQIRVTDTLHEDQYTFMIIPLSFLPRTRNVPDEHCRENKNTPFRFNTFFFFRKSYRYEITWKYMVEQDRPQMTIRCMRIAYCIPKATSTYLEYVILIVFPLQQRLHERASVLRYT